LIHKYNTESANTRTNEKDVYKYGISHKREITIYSRIKYANTLQLVFLYSCTCPCPVVQSLEETWMLKSGAGDLPLFTTAALAYILLSYTLSKRVV